MRRRNAWLLAAAAAALVGGSVACTQTKAYQKAVDDANTKGKYKVRLTTDPESVVGVCKFVTTIEPEHDIVGGVPSGSYPDYFRTQAVLAGADTVLVREGKLGEAYICGDSALNPDGTPTSHFDTPPQSP
jgi:hypothetical protein